ncbi:arsenite methyltransferase-like isoform X1 [Pelobates fuscus]|uniref:arsenite methyltransferase-like isoform X1 n=1 Tax=Pelobates fuscus TaxID=191477 RepID=UPI002FE433E8
MSQCRTLLASKLISSRLLWSLRPLCSSSSSPSCGSHGCQTYDDVKEYYGKYLKSSKDLKTNACVTPAKPLPKFVRDALNDVHDDVSSRYYGCGLVLPECLENCSILDLGSGSGRDCYMLSKLVGEKGKVTGIDMTDEQVEISRKYIDYHTKKFGYQKPNVEFFQGYIENLKAANLANNSYDIIISNCVINLSPDKRAVLAEAYRVLKDGGEMYFSDVYSNKAITEDLKNNKVLWGECISGALDWKDLFQIAEDIGFSSPRLVTSRYITVDNEELENLLGDYKFVSATFRLFKLPKNKVNEKGLVIYNGGVTGCKDEIEFDVNFTFKEGDVAEVDDELFLILKNSRFSDEFVFQPPGGASNSGGCRPKKKIITDPFQLADGVSKETKAAGSGGCCGPKGCC